MISICLTFKNRAGFLDGFFEKLLEQNFPMKEVEVCLADGGSGDDYLGVVQKYYKHFYQIKTAFCDRAALPFKIASNCPACDRNSLIANMASFEKVVVTDPEVRFRDKEWLQYTHDMLDEKDLLLCHKCYKLPKGVTDLYADVSSYSSAQFAGFCLAFNKTAFIRNGGFEEKYVFGFAGEDSYFVWWWRNNYRIRQSAHPVFHLYHTPPFGNPAFRKLREEYTLPLHERLKKDNVHPNNNNPNWQRPEMIKEELIWKS